MVPLVSCASVAGIPLAKLLPRDRIDALVERTRKGGTEIVQLLGDGSAYYAPAAGVAAMVEAILLDEKRIIPSACYLRGEYGVQDLYLGVPAVLGAKGVEKILEIELAPGEQEQLQKAAELVRETVQKVQL
jgi:malate dehydrogenase